MKMVQGQAKILGAGTETQGDVMGNRARVADGDEVAAAGKQKADGMLAYSFANMTRGTRVKYPVNLLYAAGALLIVLGLPLMLLLVGFFLIPIGIYLIVHGVQLSETTKLVDAIVSGG